MFSPQAISVKDPIIEVTSKVAFPVVKGGSYYSYRTYNTNDQSITNTTFSVPPPNPGTFISRRIWLYTQNSLTFQNNQPANPTFYFQPGFSALRQWPILSMMQTLEIVINGCSLTLPVSDIIKPISNYKYDKFKLLFRDLGGSYQMNDTYADYWSGGVNLNLFSGNPLLGPNHESYSWNGAGSRFSYNSPSYVNAYSTVGAVASVNFTDYSPLFLSPLIFDAPDDDDGFIGIQSLDINITWRSDTSRMWSNAGNMLNVGATTVINMANGGQPAWAFTSPAQLYFDYVTPPVGYQIPRSIQYNYNEIYIYSSTAAYTGGISVNNNTFEATSQSVQLNSIPRYLLIYVISEATDSAEIMYNPDTYGEITKLNVNWNNINNLFTSASQMQLYQICRKNGLNKSFEEATCKLVQVAFSAGGTGLPGFQMWYAGAPLCIEFGTNIGLNPGECPGAIGVYNLQISVEGVWRNSRQAVNGAPIANGRVTNLRLKFITITPGIFTIYDNAASKRKGVLNASQVVSAPTSSNLTYEDSRQNDFLKGGKFLKKLKKGVKKAAKFGKKALKTAAPIIETAADIAGVPEVSQGVALASDIAGVGRMGSIFTRAQKMQAKEAAKKASSAVKNAVEKAAKSAAAGMIRKMKARGTAVGGRRKKAAGRPKSKTMKARGTAVGGRRKKAAGRKKKR